MDQSKKNTIMVYSTMKKTKEGKQFRSYWTKMKNDMSSENKKLKQVIEETLSKYNSRLIETFTEEGYGDGKKVQMISEFIDDLNAVKKICVDRNRF